MESLTLRRVIALALAGLLVAMLPLVVSTAALPGITQIVVLAGTAMGLNLLVGAAGLVSMGQGLFFGLGAYGVAIANIKYGVSYGSAAFIALMITVPIAALCAFIALRAKALFFALLTLALGQVAYVFVARSYTLTGGDDGMVGLILPAWLSDDVAQHVFAAAVTTLVCLTLLILLASPFGATLRAVRDNRERVASLGGNPKFYEFTAFVIAGVLVAVMGTVWVATEGSVEPTVLSWTTSAILLVMVALGGRSMFVGPIIGTIVLETSRTFIQAHSSHSDLVVGLLVVLCAVAFPEGIGPPIFAYIKSLWRALFSKKADEENFSTNSAGKS